MKTFREMAAEQRRELLGPDIQIPYSSRAKALAKLWADRDEDEVLMQIKHADEIAEINQMMDMQILKIRAAAHRQLKATWALEPARSLKLVEVDDDDG